MSTLLEQLRHEVDDLHDFFGDWFGGKSDQNDIETQLISRLDKSLRYISPDGHRPTMSQLVGGIRNGHGNNPAFKILITDLEILYELEDKVIISYLEWQRGAANSANPENVRITTALLTKNKPFRWLHIHETWLPEESQKGDFPKF